MDVTHEISKLVKFSPKRNAIFDKLKEELSPDTPGTLSNTLDSAGKKPTECAG